MVVLHNHFSRAHLIRTPHVRSLTSWISRGTRSVRTNMAGQDDVALAVVNKQLQCYNGRDIESFMALMADDVHVSNGETGAVIATSKQQLRPRYEERFKTAVHAELLGRVCLGDTVVDREIITGLPDGGEADCLATYVIKNGQIAKMQFVWRPRTPTAHL